MSASYDGEYIVRLVLPLDSTEGYLCMQLLSATVASFNKINSPKRVLALKNIYRFLSEIRICEEKTYFIYTAFRQLNVFYIQLPNSSMRKKRNISKRQNLQCKLDK